MNLKPSLIVDNLLKTTIIILLAKLFEKLTHNSATLESHIKFVRSRQLVYKELDRKLISSHLQVKSQIHAVK